MPTPPDEELLLLQIIGIVKTYINDEEAKMLSTILIVILILMLIGALPNWGYSRSWGYGPGGGLGLILLIVIILALMGRI